MSEEVQAALTEEEWEWLFVEQVNDRSGGAGIEDSTGELYITLADYHGAGGEPDIGVTDRHALAALALHDQPFGFTWEDVEACLKIEGGGGQYEQEEAVLRSLATRLAALLPPRGPQEEG